MASRRLIAASLSRRTFHNRRYPPTALSCITFPYKQERRDDNNVPTSLIQVRSFSALDSFEDRARERARKGAKAARKAARQGAKSARKGAKSAKEMMKQYGPVFVGTYFSVYLLTWGAIFVGMDSGVIDPVQIMGYISGGMEESKSTVHLLVEYLEKYEFTKQYAPIVEKNPHVANLGVAWVANKFTEPARLLVTIGIVPSLARHFGFVHKDDDEEHHDDDHVEEDQVVSEEKKEADVPQTKSESPKN